MTSEHGGDRHSIDAKVTAAVRADEALRLRIQRVSYRVIAARLGYSNPSSAHRAVARALKNLPRENALTLRTQELETLDRMQAQLMPQVLRDSPALGAVDRVLRIMDTRARLMGLYEPAADTGVDEFKAVLLAWSVNLTREVDAAESLHRDRGQITEGKETS